MKNKTCCFTGHRYIPPESEQRIAKNLERKTRELINVGYLYFGVGGAAGFDTLAAKTLIRLRQNDFPQIKVILVYPFDGFTNRWNDEQKITYSTLLPCYDKVVCVSSAPGKDAYLARNRHLVNWSSYCICYLTKDSGGTAYTVDYARKAGLQIHNTAPIDFLRRGRDI